MKIEWELVQDNDSCDDYEFWRTPVPSGWLVTTETDKFKWGTLTFVPDPTHSWGKEENEYEKKTKLAVKAIEACKMCDGNGTVFETGPRGRSQVICSACGGTGKAAPR